MSDYPRMLYRKGSEYRVWNVHDVDTRIVADEAEHLDAMDKGWVTNPADTVVIMAPKAAVPPVLPPQADPIPPKSDPAPPKGKLFIPPKG